MKILMTFILIMIIFLPAKATLEFLKPHVDQPKDCNDQVFKPIFYDVDENATVGTLVEEIKINFDHEIKWTFHMDQECQDIFDCYSISKYDFNITVEKKFPKSFAECISSFKVEDEQKDQICLYLYLRKKDVNDNYPVLTNVPRIIYVEEENPLKSPLLTVNATDEKDKKDYGTKGIIFKLESQSAGTELINSIFNVTTEAVENVKQGKLYLMHPLNYENRTVYNFDLVACDDNGNGLCSKEQVIIQVNDTDDNPPEFVQQTSIVKIPEDIAVGEKVFSVSAEDKDKGNPNKILYKILKGEGSNNFTIEEFSGIVKVRTPLKRESLPEGTIGYTLTILAVENSTKHYNATTQCTVILQDVNNCPPQFQKKNYTGSVNEGSNENAVVQLNEPAIIVTDKDLGENATFSVSVIDTNLFKISPEGGIQQAYFSLFKNLNIDYENLTEKFISFELLATDKKNSSLMDSVTVKVEVLDVNDNVPQFINSSYVIEIYEDQAVASSIITISATDNDSLWFGTKGIRYSFRQNTQYFQINEISGIVTVKEKLDRETIATHLLTVEAKDNNGTGLSNSAELKINLKDVNDHNPKILSITGYTISENTNVNETVLLVNGEDADEGRNGSIIFGFDEKTNTTITECLTFQRTTDKSSKVVVTKSLHGIVGPYELWINASDDGMPIALPSTESLNYSLYIKDENDRPKITKPKNGANVYIMENTNVIPPEMCIEAHDDDRFPPGDSTLIYTLTKYTDIFKINGSCILPALDKGLDRETKSIYDITYKVCDTAYNPLCDEATFALHVNNTNDEFPLFDKSEVILNFTEELMPDDNENYQQLIKAFDKDNEGDDGFNNICYFIKDENFKDVFSLNVTSGILKPNITLDYETQTSYDLQIFANNECFDNSANITEILDTTNGYRILHVHIKVLDINDNPPTFTKILFGGSVDINTNEPTTQILILSATDKDSDENARLQFYILGPVFFYENGKKNSAKNLIKLNKDTGVIETTEFFRTDKSGFLSFSVFVNNTKELVGKHVSEVKNSTANVKIFLMNEKQKLIFILYKSFEEFQRIKNDFESLLMQLLPKQYTMYFDKILPYSDQNTVLKMMKTAYNGGSNEMCKVSTYFINNNDYSIVDPLIVQNILDETPINNKIKNELDSQFQLGNINVGTDDIPREDNIEFIVEILIITVIALTVSILILLLALYCARVSRLQRQLKAAVVPTYNKEDEIKKNDTILPNTNLHNFEGSNPIWNLEGSNELVNETNDDDVSIQSDENFVENAKDFEGGNYNEGFAGMVEQIFMKEESSITENRDDKNKLNNKLNDNFIITNYDVKNIEEDNEIMKTHSSFADLSITDI